MVITALDHVPHCYSREDGAAVFKLLWENLQTCGTVTLSMSGVSDVPSSFVNAALVPLLDTMSFEQFKQKVFIIHANRQINDMIRRCFSGSVKVAA